MTRSSLSKLDRPAIIKVLNTIETKTRPELTDIGPLYDVSLRDKGHIPDSRKSLNLLVLSPKKP